MDIRVRAVDIANISRVSLPTYVMPRDGHPLNETRRNVSVKHDKVVMDKQRTCIWCCQRCQMPIDGIKHSLQGFRMRYKCSICWPALCIVSIIDGTSCLELFHQSEDLFNPCTDHGHHINVRARSDGAKVAQSSNSNKFVSG
jgi:hypothetical protein